MIGTNIYTAIDSPPIFWKVDFSTSNLSSFEFGLYYMGDWNGLNKNRSVFESVRVFEASVELE
jgi:hypothetical protein